MRDCSPRTQALVALAVMFAIGIALRSYPPPTYPLYPPCFIHTWSGLLCPGCGGTRAMAALLAGRWSDAADSNVLTVVLTPPVLFYTAVQMHSAVCWKRWRAISIPRPVLALAVAVAVVLAVARNIRPLF